MSSIEQILAAEAKILGIMKSREGDQYPKYVVGKAMEFHSEKATKSALWRLIDRGALEFTVDRKLRVIQ